MPDAAERLPTRQSDESRTTPLIRPRPATRRWSWLVMVPILVAVAAGWYLRERPAASFKETIGTIGRPDAMTVEAIAEGGSSIIGRNVSIVDARVSA